MIMQVQLFALVAASSALLALAAPVAHDCPVRSEEQPWQITQLTTFDADATSTTPSSISFHFKDVNAQLELATICTKKATAGSGYKSDGYSACSDTAVGFAFNGTELKVKRRYMAVSPSSCTTFPATAFGHATANLKPRASANGTAGTTLYQDRLNITVTGIAA